MVGWLLRLTTPLVGNHREVGIRKHKSCAGILRSGIVSLRRHAWVIPETWIMPDRGKDGRFCAQPDKDSPNSKKVNAAFTIMVLLVAMLLKSCRMGGSLLRPSCCPGKKLTMHSG